MTKPLTLEQGIIIQGFTGMSTVPFMKFYADVTKRMKCDPNDMPSPIALSMFKDTIRKLYEADFTAMVAPLWPVFEEDK